MDYKLIITVVVCWILPTLLNLWHYFGYRPQWKTLGDILIGFSFSVIPLINIGYIIWRYIGFFELLLSKDSNRDNLNVYDFITFKENDFDDIHRFYNHLDMYDTHLPITRFDFIFVIPLSIFYSLIVKPLSKVLQWKIQERN